MTRDEWLKMFEVAGAVKRGHFELSSGLHSAMYVQCALVLQYSRFAERLGAGVAELFADIEADVVVSPAMGGLIIGQEVARALPERGTAHGEAPLGSGAGIAAIFVERDAAGAMAMRRGFSLREGERVLVIEDVWTTGGSTREAIRVIEAAGGRVVGAGALIDRSGGKIELGVSARALIDLTIPSYETKDCPLCAEGSVAVKPGSRFKGTASGAADGAEEKGGTSARMSASLG
jgi:orotate phosphoribosyltransferase